MPAQADNGQASDFREADMGLGYGIRARCDKGLRAAPRSASRPAKKALRSTGYVGPGRRRPRTNAREVLPRFLNKGAIARLSASRPAGSASSSA